MPIFTVIIVIALFGLLLWAINTYVPMSPPFLKPLLNVLAIVLIVLWLLKVFGIWSGAGISQPVL